MTLVRRSMIALGALLALVACDDDDGAVDGGGLDAAMTDAGDLDAGQPGDPPADYTFDSRFEPGTSSVVHTGQTARHLLIEDMKGYIGGLGDAIDGAQPPFDDGVEMGEVSSGLEYYFSIDGADRAGDPIRLTLDSPLTASTYGDVSGSANLLGKLAGNDTATDYQDWSSAFVGWQDATVFADGADVSNPTGLVRAMFATLDEAAVARGLGNAAQSPVDTPMDLPVYVTAEGLDLQQLLQKFLLGAIAFHQAADDYTHDDVADKGLLADNTMASGDSPYTALEHAWDEAWGYYGAAVTYNQWTAADLAAGPVYVDRDGDGSIELGTEYNWGASVNAAKRDNGAVAATNFMGEAGEAFRAGRHIITTANGALSTEQADALRAERDRAIGAWEAAIAATVVHYINDTLQAMADFDTAAYDHDAFLNHAKVWSEMKGFALTFQFNPNSPLSASDFAMVHQLMGDRPVLEAAGTTEADDYRQALRDARAIVGNAYGFDAMNLGDDGGENGW